MHYLAQHPQGLFIVAGNPEGEEYGIQTGRQEDYQHGSYKQTATYYKQIRDKYIKDKDKAKMDKFGGFRAQVLANQSESISISEAPSQPKTPSENLLSPKDSVNPFKLLVSK